MINYFLGFDNGVTGTMGILGHESPFYFSKVPIKTGIDFNKSKSKNISRIDIDELYTIILGHINENYVNEIFAVLEKPLKNSQRFEASISGARAYEALLIVLESIGIGYDTIDSGKWQKMLLPGGLKGAPEQKQASKDVGIRMFPQFEQEIEEHGDADGILIAEYCRRIYK